MDIMPQCFGSFASEFKLRVGKLCPYNVEVERDFGALGPKWDVSIKVLPLRIRNLCGRGSGKIAEVRSDGFSKETVSSRSNRTMCM